MEGSREPGLDELFHQLRALSPAEREPRLRAEGERDAARAARLRALLAADAAPTAELLREGARPEAHPEPARVGRYRLLRVLGEGGMGTVHLAEQEEPVKRLVALKVLRIGRNTKDVADRFHAERQALALMDHPGIARIFDGGLTESGLPYFAMEYVPGSPVDEYCERERLTIAARLRLVMRICDAVQHAHQKGIIHRDLKPSNVLVPKDEPQPKIIDFGIARALWGPLAGESMDVSTLRVVGTLAYMSPEQARGDDVDTRADVFSLGVLLERLLVGEGPWDAEEVADLQPRELVRRIQEQEPRLPSARARELVAARPALAAARRLEPRAFVRALEGDLDWIVARATARDRAQRYGSVSELAADLGHHLAHEPVVAAPSGAGYLMGKFVARHRIAVAMSCALALLLVGATVVATVLWRRAARLGERAAHEAERATYQAERARGIVDFMELAIADRSLDAERGDDPTVRSLLRDPVADLGRRYDEKQAIEAGVLTSLARMLLDLGDDERALSLLLRAQTLQQERSEPDAYDRFETLDALIRAERRVHGPDAAAPYVPRALLYASATLEDLTPRESAALEALLRYQAGAAVVDEQLIEGLDVLLEGLPPTLLGRDPRVHALARVALEVAERMSERGSPALPAYLERLEARARALTGPQSISFARILWKLTRHLHASGAPTRELARAHARLLAAACADLPADHWLRRESERLSAELQDG